MSPFNPSSPERFIFIFYLLHTSKVNMSLKCLWFQICTEISCPKDQYPLKETNLFFSMKMFPGNQNDLQSINAGPGRRGPTSHPTSPLARNMLMLLIAALLNEGLRLPSRVKTESHLLSLKTQVDSHPNPLTPQNLLWVHRQHPSTQWGFKILNRIWSTTEILCVSFWWITPCLESSLVR